MIKHLKTIKPGAKGTKIPVLFFLWICSIGLYAQPLSTTGGLSAAELVQNVLLGGGVQVSNISFQGSPNAIGVFNGATSNIGLSYGIVMTTGTIYAPNGPQGPNDRPDSGIDNGTPGYSLLNPLTTKPTYNATVISFDFVPQGDTVAFRYVFGSEEYKEYVGTDYNDVFGFFISGPNPNGGNYVNKNIALIPATTIPVAINNVNHLANSAYYVDNELPFPGSTVQYDGFTTVLTAITGVVPCNTYTIRIAIADVADGIYDSGVFLEAHSFSSKGLDLSHRIIGGPHPDTLYESCGNAEVSFTWTGNNSTDRTVNYTVYGTATNGVDYNFLPGSIVIPAGQSSATLNITAVNDGIPEPLEYIVIELVDETACPNVVMPRDTIFLANVDPLVVTARPDTTLECNNQTVILWADVEGGAGTVTYSWSHGVGTGNYMPVLARETTTYIISAIDGCNESVIDEVTIFVPNIPPLTLTFTPDTAICPGEPIELNASASGGIGNIIYSWSTGHGNVNSITVFPEFTTLYSIVVNDSCGNTLTGSSLVQVQEPSADFFFRYTENRTLAFTSIVTPDVVTYEWFFGDGNISAFAHPTHAYADTGYFEVILVVTNQFGCTDTVVQTIYAYPDFVFFIPNTFTPNLDGLNDVFSGKGLGFIEYEMIIFDRWGGKVFETNDLARGWPGTDRSDNKCQIGVYAYKVQIITPPGEVHTYIGHINLIR